MKAQLLIPIVLALVGMALGFLASAFVAASFDITAWTMDGRFAGAMLMFAFGGCGAVLGIHLLREAS